MQLFLELGRKIHEEWRRSAYRELAFPDIACRHLADASLERRVSPEDVLGWVAASDHLPHQVEFNFGIPITLYHDSYFYIDCLFWLEGTTDVHEHGFVGAFTVLHGSSIHSRYQFDPDLAISDRVAIGSVRPVHAENLESGDVRPIHPGSAGAHTLFHVDRPSVSVVVRTPLSTQSRVQHSYIYPSVAYDGLFYTPEQTRCSRALSLMHEIAPDKLTEFGARLLSRSEPLSFVRHARYLFERLPSEAACEQVLSTSSSVPAELVQALARTVPHIRRATTLAAYRGDVSAPRHRYLLGLLRTAQTRQAIFKLIAEKYPGVDPTEFIVETVGEMSRLAESGGASRIFPFDEASLLVLDGLLRGSTSEQIVDRLAEKYDDVHEQLGAIEELVDVLRKSSVFRPLLG